MLRELSIENLAIIEEARITFGEGLNVLTGETGAGKSLLVAALELVLGERAKAEWIRADAEEARVEAVIDLENTPELSEILADAGRILAGAERLPVPGQLLRRDRVRAKAQGPGILAAVRLELRDHTGQPGRISCLTVCGAGRVL